MELLKMKTLVFCLFLSFNVYAHDSELQANYLAEKSIRTKIVKLALDQKNKPYIWDKCGPDAFDCSGFVHYIFKTALGEVKFNLPYDLEEINELTEIPYINQSQYFYDELLKADMKIDCNKALPADVVFFPKTIVHKNNHIGIITSLKPKKFITAQSTKTGVAEASFEKGTYYDKRSPECFTNAWISSFSPDVHK
jgi:cell wall-associated NlpC family hydrolase